MKALVFNGPGKKAVEDRPLPKIAEPTDAIVKMVKTTICGTDLHILKGDVPTCTPGRILGHEGVGVVDKVGAAVTAFHPGDRVIVSCISSCGKCDYCRRGIYSHCVNGGSMLGNKIDGTQAEYVRIPFADTSLYHIPENAEQYAAGAFDDYICCLNPGGSVAWTARGIFTQRGKLSFGPLEVRLGDPFGLFPKTVRLRETGAVLVYPAIHPVESVLGPVWMGASFGDVRRGRGLDVPPDISSVRDHAPDDGLSRIHWPSTARAGRLISRLYKSRQSSDVMVLLDLARGTHFGEAPEITLEYAVSLAASICHAALARGQAVGLLTNDRLGTAIGPGRGETQRLRILEFLALAQDSGRRPIAAAIAQHGRSWQGRGGLIVVTSDRDPEWVEALVEVGVRGQRHLAVLVEPTSFELKPKLVGSTSTARWRCPRTPTSTRASTHSGSRSSASGRPGPASRPRAGRWRRRWGGARNPGPGRGTRGSAGAVVSPRPGPIAVPRRSLVSSPTAWPRASAGVGRWRRRARPRTRGPVRAPRRSGCPGEVEQAP